MEEWKNELEVSVVAGTLVSGTGTATRSMQGFARFASTLATAQSGVSLTSDMLNTFMRTAWSVGKEHDTILVGGTLKSRISGFTAGSTKNVDATDKRLVNAVDVYESDAARMVKLFAHRYVTVSGDYVTTATPGFDVLALNEGSWAIAYLSGREPQTIDLAKTGDADRKEIVTELTLEARAPKSNYYGQLFF